MVSKIKESDNDKGSGIIFWTLTLVIGAYFFFQYCYKYDEVISNITLSLVVALAFVVIMSIYHLFKAIYTWTDPLEDNHNKGSNTHKG